MSCGGDFFKALHISWPELVEVSAPKIRTYSLTMYLKNYATIGWLKKGIFAFLDASWSNPKSQDECLIYQP